jgi:Zn-dependent protease with chaperone function
MRINKRTIFLQVLSIFTLATLAACGSVPITGRSQLNLVSDQELNESANTSYANFISTANSKNAVLVASESPAAAATIAMVNRVSDRIIDAAGLRGKYKWETVVIKSKTPNAFVMPNGKIVVFTGIIPIAKGEAGLAAIIGHEVAHVVARHSAERLSQALLAQTILSAADAAMAAKNTKSQPAISAALGIGAQYGVMLPFSREHESEADHIGLLYMAKAGYDPSEAVGVWQRMESMSGKGPWEILSTHPSHATRRANLEAWQPEAALYYAERARPLPRSLTEIQMVQAAQLKKTAVAPTAFAPDIKPGFWYTTHSTAKGVDATYRVERKESCDAGECLFVTGNSGAKTTLTSSFGLMRNEQQDGTWSQFSPPLQQIKFPLSVGDSWNNTVTQEYSTGKKQQLPLKFSVVAYEPITVKAGQFQAYKIVAAINGIRFREMWYAPETGTFARTVTVDIRGKETISELVDYQKSVDVAGDL